MNADNFDAGDYDTDDRVFCKDCHEWGWPDSGDVKLCPTCEERYCVECMKDHTCIEEENIMVRAKVTCQSLEGNTVSFHTVYETDAQKSDENVRFTQATPWGEIRLGIDNPKALEQFKVGESYYVDFTPAPKA